ncbi:MAG: hypothetical protein KGL75_04025 [Acidobacteriota bacterium]|nr:hypothetical protein [Acidobacteriota bacterium]
MHPAKLLLVFCQWALHSNFGHAVRDSVWLFPAVEICHLLGLAVLGGTVLLLNLRLMNLRFPNEPVAELAHDVQPLMVGSLAVMLISGFFLFSSEAVKMYGNVAFRYKMIFLLLAIMYTFTIYRKVVMSGEGRVPLAWRVSAALLSLVLWAGVGFAGRAIGYV